MLDTLRHGQKNLNKKFVAKGKIASVEKELELVASAPVKDDEVLPMSICKVIDQYKIISMARCVVDENEDNRREAQLADNVVGEMSWSGAEEEIVQDLPRYVFLVLIASVFNVHNRINMPSCTLLLGHP